MKAYVILEGGGVKGAALAGSLAAAENNGVEVAGFGGASAGAIVATLAASGYGGKKIGEELVKREFTTFLSKKARRLSALKKGFGAASCDEDIVKRMMLKLPRIIFATAIIIFNWRRMGLYDGNKLIEILEGLIKVNMPTFSRQTTFKEFNEMGGIGLKIVASDITNKKPVIFSLEKTPGQSVLDAVRTSAGYPFVFRPFLKKLKDGEEEVEIQLVDGGLSSNLPSFLFHEEYKKTGVPTLLMDLVQDGSHKKCASNLAALAFDLLGTALESSDHILIQLGTGVIHVPVEIPNDVGTLDFDIDNRSRELVYLKGKSSVEDFLADHDRFKILKTAGSGIREQLIATHGAAELYETILSAMLNEIKQFSNAKDVRACIMLPTDRNSLKIAYHAGFKEAPDTDLELQENEGAAWDIWGNPDKIVVFGDLTEEGYDLKLEDDNRKKIPEDRKSLMCWQIYADPTEEEPIDSYGVIGIDSSTLLQETDWADDTLKNPNPIIFGIVNGWLQVIPLVMKASLL